MIYYLTEMSCNRKTLVLYAKTGVKAVFSEITP